MPRTGNGARPAWLAVLLAGFAAGCGGPNPRPGAGESAAVPAVTDYKAVRLPHPPAPPPPPAP